MELLNETKAETPEETINIFLKRYRKQEDIEMMDLKAT